MRYLSSEMTGHALHKLRDDRTCVT